MSRGLRVGIFVLTGLLLLGAASFLIGDNRKVWDRKVTYQTAFQNVQGLKGGSPIRMGGLDIGTVITVKHGEASDDARVYVTLSVLKSESLRIRKDTKARVSAKGLLGDKMVELTVGQSTDVAKEGDTLESEEPSDLLARADEIATRAKVVMERLDPLAKELGDPRLHENIRGITSNVNEILDTVAHKDSAVHRMFYDPDQAQKVSNTLGHIERSTAEAQGILSDVHKTTTHVRTGDGLAHRLLYDEKLAKDAVGTVDEVHKSLVAVREGNGVAHTVLYGDEHSQSMIVNLAAMASDLRSIVSGIRQGKGTIGGLLVDPSIYEDLKSAVGNIERNQVLRALVRYSIRQDDSKPTVDVKPTGDVKPQASAK